MMNFEPTNAECISFSIHNGRSNNQQVEALQDNVSISILSMSKDELAAYSGIFKSCSSAFVLCWAIKVQGLILSVSVLAFWKARMTFVFFQPLQESYLVGIINLRSRHLNKALDVALGSFFTTVD
jgi:hypothetical protein